MLLLCTCSSGLSSASLQPHKTPLPATRDSPALHGRNPPPCAVGIAVQVAAGLPSQCGVRKYGTTCQAVCMREVSASREETQRSHPPRQGINNPKPGQTGLQSLQHTLARFPPQPAHPFVLPSNGPELRAATLAPQRQPERPRDKAAHSPKAGHASTIWAPKAVLPAASFNPWVLLSVLVQTNSSFFSCEPDLLRGAAAPGLQNQLSRCNLPAGNTPGTSSPKPPVATSALWHLSFSGSWPVTTTARGHT